jgi:hypothetical protein
MEAEAPQHALQEFFRLRAQVQPELRRAFQDAFNRDIALDYSSMKRWYFKVGPSFGALSDSLDELRAQLSSGELLKEQGDGYQSFTGIVLAVLTFPDRPLLLDEPEAFLHPQQARVLGRWLAERSRTRNAQIVVATHSADFLWGVMSGNTGADVLRLRREGNDTRFVHVPGTTIKQLTLSPLLSSQPVLDSLFHQGVVICEGDPDRALYQAVAHKELAGEGGEDVLFIHTNGKDAADMPVELLRTAGVPVCIIADIDVLNSRDTFAKIVRSLTGKEISAELEQRRSTIGALVESMPEDHFLSALMKAVEEWLKTPQLDARTARRRLLGAAKSVSSKWDGVKKKGVLYFDDAGQELVRRLLLELAGIGLFVVPCGELERWIDGAPKGKGWNRLALELIQNGACPPNLRDFVGDVVRYLSGSGKPMTPEQS